MDKDENTRNSFIGYEYKEVDVPRDMEGAYVDGYTSFGWEVETGSLPIPISSTALKMKRDRKIRNKAELTRLQRKFEADLEEIQKLERSKNVKASVVAYIVGIIGAAFMAGSVFAITADNIVLCIILAIPALIGWVIPYFAYRKIESNTIKNITPIIDKKYDEVYEVCEKASKLAG